MHRVPAIDNLRGWVMILMTLDHTRDFFTDVTYNPIDLTQTTPALFLTRWITHYCAPVFIFLAGTSAFLSAQRVGKWQQSRLLLTRGLWIAFLGVTFESMIWTFTPDFSVMTGSVLWAIGWSMMSLSILVFLGLPWIMAFGMALILGHNAFDNLSSQELGGFGALWSVLHTGDKIQLSTHLVFKPYYPLIPWLGVMAVGYGFGGLMLLDEQKRNTWSFRLGMVLISLFMLLRVGNIYGDPQPWSAQKSALFTVFSILNCHKYPPSLCYLLMTLGPAIALMPLFGKAYGKFADILQVFGQTPMFFYLLHLPLIIALSLCNTWLRIQLDSSLGANLLENFPTTYGYGLPVVYLVWILVLALLYPVCRHFREIKRTNGYWLFKYL